MGEIIKLFSTRLELMCADYITKISLMPSWQLDSILPAEIKEKNINNKLDYLLEKYKMNNPVYKLINEDLNLIRQGVGTLSCNELKSINIDPRYLESFGLNETELKKHFEFIAKVKAVFKL